MRELPPIFLIPRARTGGTLLITMLDAHPELAMSYEIYPQLLSDSADRPFTPNGILEAIDSARPSTDDPTAWIRAIQQPNLRTFLFRARRAGLGMTDIVDELRAFSADHQGLDTPDDRLALIERLMRRKAANTHKRGWGGKMLADPFALHARYAEARFLLILRDGRDMTASLLTTGHFNTSAARAAEDWKRHILDFRAFATRSGAHAMEVRYESLVADPVAILTEVCAFIGVPYSSEMLAYHEHDLSLFRNPHGHLSHKQLVRGLNDRSVGRWRSDLTAQQVSEFTDVAGDLLAELGYT